MFAQKGTAGDVQAEVSAVYDAPEGATGHWELAIADDVPADSLPEIQQAIDDANLNGSTTLQFTTGSFNTFTWYKVVIVIITSTKKITISVIETILSTNIGSLSNIDATKGLRTYVNITPPTPNRKALPKHTLPSKLNFLSL